MLINISKAYFIAISVLFFPNFANSQLSPPIPKEYTWAHHEFGDTELAYTLSPDFLFGVACDRYPMLLILEVDFDVLPLGKNLNATLSFKRFRVELTVDEASRTDIDFLDGPTLTLKIKNPSKSLERALLRSLAEGKTAEIDLYGNRLHYDGLFIGLSESKNALTELACY